jgi:hypothetical protein
MRWSWWRPMPRSWNGWSGGWRGAEGDSHATSSYPATYLGWHVWQALTFSAVPSTARTASVSEQYGPSHMPAFGGRLAHSAW